MSKVLLNKEDVIHVADNIRSLTGVNKDLTLKEMATVRGDKSLGVSTTDVNFYDYDGTVLYSYTVEEAQELTELPLLPFHQGLICQGWNYDLQTIQGHNRAINVGAMYITDDGKTRIYVHLEEGRTSPILGVTIEGSVTVDWGDGSVCDVLTSVHRALKWTPPHSYEQPGDYVITLNVTRGHITIQGDSTYGCSLLRHPSNKDNRNKTYLNSIQKVELGNNVSLGSYAFRYCSSLASITIPEDVTEFGGYYTFGNCSSLASITIPEAIKQIPQYAFLNCYSLNSISIPYNEFTFASYAFQNCSSLTSITIPHGVKSISYSFYGCSSLASLFIPSTIKSIGANTFNGCSGISIYDFTSHESIPTLTATTAFTGISEDCVILVPHELYEGWVAATNWSNYRAYIFTPYTYQNSLIENQSSELENLSNILESKGIEDVGEDTDSSVIDGELSTQEALLNDQTSKIKQLEEVISSKI